MRKRAVREPVLVARPCGCEYLTGVVALGPTVACGQHRYMQCGKCHGRAEVTPFGLWCSHCTFGNEIIPWEPADA